MGDFGMVLEILPPNLRDAALKLPGRIREKAEEIRLRIGREASVLTADEEIVLIHGRPVERVDMLSVLERATMASFHTAQNAVSKGYFTVHGGCRIGICGAAVMKNGELENFRDISSLAIRVEREVIGCSDIVFDKLTQDGFMNTLIISPPGSGKTTLLRDLIRQLSDSGVKVSLADERAEVSGMFEGKPGFDIGRCTDVITGAPKAKAVMLMLRSMSPNLIALDEITAPEDITAMLAAAGCGVRLLATAHSDSVSELSDRRIYRELLAEGIFKRAVTIKRCGSERRYEVIQL